MHPRRWAALAVLLVGMFMDLMDTTIVTVALPSIRDQLGTDYAVIQWVAAGYTLAFAVGLITGGRLGDRYGRRRMFVLGVAAFTVFSTVCGLAPNAEVLVGARIVQGFAAAVMVPQILGTMIAIFPLRERAAANGLFGAIGGLASVAGPLLGGVLIGSDLFGLGWRSIFLVNIPIGVITLVAALLVVPETRAPQASRPDLVGMLMVSAALVLLLGPLVQGRELGWPPWMFVSIAAAPLVFVLLRLHRRVGVPVELFTRRGFSVGLLVVLVFQALMSAFVLAMTVTLQAGLGYTALGSGLVSITFVAGVVVSTGLVNALVARLGRDVITIGAVVMAVGLVGVFMEVESGFWQLAPWMFVGGLGMGGVIGPAYTIAGAELDTDNAGAASGILSAAGQLGAALGVALLGVVFFTGEAFTTTVQQTGWFLVGGLILVAVLSRQLPANNLAGRVSR